MNELDHTTHESRNPHSVPPTIARMYCHACDVSTSVVGHVSYGSLDTGMQECDTCRSELACYVRCGNREIELG